MTSEQQPSLVVGLFVGGQSSRMGGVAKGNLQAPGSELSLVERLCAEIRAALPEAELVLVGAAEPYAALGIQAIADRPPGIGPLGGLLGLLAHAGSRGRARVLALACDLPRLDRRLIARLATEAADRAVVLLGQESIRNPLLACYSVEAGIGAAEQCLSAEQRSLQAVLDRLEPSLCRLRLSPEESALLLDWDTPDDVRSGGGSLG